MWKLDNTLLNVQWSKEETQEKLENILREVKMETKHIKFKRCSKSSAKRQIYSCEYLH